MNAIKDHLTLSAATEWLSKSENIHTTLLKMPGEGNDFAIFSLPPGWNVGLGDKEQQDPTEATVSISGKDYTLTKEAIFGIAHAVGLKPAYVSKTPGVLIQSHLNYWAQYAGISLKLLRVGDTILATTKEGIVPFSNVQLLETALEAVADAHDIDWDDAYLDFKTHHDLHTTNLRVILPMERVIDGEVWNSGFQITNSLTGKHPLAVQGYMFRKDGALGVLTEHEAGRYNRKVQGQDFSEVLMWVAESAVKAVDGLEHEFDVMSALVDEDMEDTLSKVLADVFKTYQFPLSLRHMVMDDLVANGGSTYFELIKAISKTANTEDLKENFVTTVLRVAGDVAQHAHDRCNSCQRVLI